MQLVNTQAPENNRPLTWLLWVCIASLAALPGSLIAGEPAFSNLFSDHMVLQRERPLNVWGTASPGDELRVSLGQQVRDARADESGKWNVEFPAMGAGGPYRLELASANSIRVLEDILVGDVWLCSGQSNMEYPVKHLNEPWRDTRETDSSIRLLTVGHHSSTNPLSEFRELKGWETASAESVASFSAACYLFARELQKDVNVPFGLINASWGGSAIEAWISAQGLRKLDTFQRSLELNALYERDSNGALQAYVDDWQSWWKAAGGAQPAPWKADFDDSDWTAAPAQLGDWRKWDNVGTTDFTGMVWYRNSFELDVSQASRGAMLELGGVDEVDVTWINGKAVGAMFGWGTQRNYLVEEGILSSGTNVLAVNVYNSWAAGGLEGPPDSIRLVLPDGSHVSLAEGWKIRRVIEPAARPPMTPWSSITGVTGLYNAMIAPLDEFALSGVLWYQGESNTDRAKNYETLLTTMIADWRRSLGENLPFIIIQLPEFGTLPDGPGESGWAGIRNAQQRVAIVDPLSGLVVTVGSGDPLDIHPPNKRQVGVLAAAVARGLLPGGDEVVDGIVPLRASLSGSEVTVSFADEGMPLMVSGAANPTAFELCDDQGACRYVSAHLDQNRVVLDSSKLSEPAEVRHAWADVPLINLYSSQGIPVSSFSLPIDYATD